MSYRFRESSFDSFVYTTPFGKLDVVPSHPSLESCYKIYKLRDALKSLEGYDAIYIDTPPALNFFTRSALIAVERCLIPFDCDDFSRRALYPVLENVQEIRRGHNPDLSIEGIIINQFQPRASLPQQLVDELRGEDLPVLNSHLSLSVKIRESHQHARPIIYLEPRHKLAQEYARRAERLTRGGSQHHVGRAQGIRCVRHQAVLFVVLLFGAADTFEWGAGWAWLVLMFGGGVVTVLIAKRDPALLAERMRSPMQLDQPLWDKVFLVAMGIICCVWHVFMGLDAVRFRWSVMPLWLASVGSALMAVSF